MGWSGTAALLVTDALGVCVCSVKLLNVVELM